MSKEYSNTPLEFLMRPKSIAIYGCSPEGERAFGNIPLQLLLKSGYTGKIFPINPKYQEVSGLHCYPSVWDIPAGEEVDLAFILIPYARIIEVLEECGARGVKAAIIGSGGFGEVSGEGTKRQERIREIVKETGIRVMGPNCLGLINLVDSVYATFAPVTDLDLFPGKVGIITQSGSVGLSLINRLADKGVGVSYFLSTGNEVDLEYCDFLEFLLDDPSIEIIGAFIESFKSPQRFLKLADRALELGKPLVICRAGSSEKGAKAILAHTGALAGSSRVYEAVIKQKGVLRAESYDDLVGIITILAKARLPKGDRVGIITTSGGAAGIMADNCGLRNVRLADLSDHIREEIARMQIFGTAQNPLDLTGQVGSDPELFMRCLNLLVKDQNIDIMLIIFTNLFGKMGRGILNTVEEVMQKAGKPFIGMVAGGSMTDDCMKPAEKGPLPLFRNFHETLRSIKAFTDYARFREGWEKKVKKEVTLPEMARVNLEEIRGWLREKEGALTEDESKSFLAKYGIPMTREGLANSLDEAKGLAGDIGYPVAMKVISPQILHKTEAQVIRLNVGGEKELEEAYHQLLEKARSYPAEIKGILIQEMVKDGTEVIVGVNRDEFFGPTILFGLGGIYVEILKDLSLRLAPVDWDEALGMIQEIKGYEILTGARGRPRRDIEAIAQVILRLSQLALDLGDCISAVDINPLIVLKDGMGVKAVDALVVL